MELNSCIFERNGGFMEDQKSGYRIMDIETSERPRERLARLGPQALNTAELLAILLRVGVQGENAVQVGHRLLKNFSGIKGIQKASVAELEGEHGLGFAKACQIKAAIELGRRLAMESPDARPSISNPADAARLLMYEMSALEQENLKVINLNTKNEVIEIDNLYQGSLNSSTVRVAEVFKSAIRRNAASIIIVHNHPSGDPTPSTDDIVVTRAIIEAGKMLEVDVLDHVVIGDGRFISMKEKGLAFN
jgi:DNA repair protein RadC